MTRGDLYNKHFSQSWEAGKSKVKVPAWLSCGEQPLPGCPMDDCSLCIQVPESREQALWALFNEGSILVA